MTSSDGKTNQGGDTIFNPLFSYGETNQGGDTIQGGTLFSIPFFSYGETNQGGKPRTTDTQKNLTFNCKMSLIFE